MAWKGKEGLDSNLGDCLEVGAGVNTHHTQLHITHTVHHSCHTHVPHTTLSDMYSQIHVVW